MRILATDFDNTLFRSREITRADAEAVARFRSAGNRFGLVTGRHLASIRDELARWDLPLDFVIACTGGILTDGQFHVLSEHRAPKAALVPLYLGVKAVITKSVARIHCANLINAGILPLNFQNEADYDKISQGDELSLPNIKSELESGAPVTLENKTTGERYKLTYSLSERQKDILLAGGLLNYTRESL